MVVPTNYTKVTNISSLRAGDHIAVWDYSRWPITYQHHGIVWAAGDTPETVQICHVWSPLEGFQAAQADSCFRISTLEEFMYKRNARNLRVVEYNTSSLREVISKWGEVHYSKADLPEVVLARCKFLMGLGKGEFHIFKQNCEHAAHWCMTGEQWCKQNLTRGKGRVPFEQQIPKQRVDGLFEEIESIKAISKKVVDSILQLSGQLVYLRVNGGCFAKVLPDGRVGVTDSMEDGTMFRLKAYCKVYNCVKVSFVNPHNKNSFMYSRSTFSCFRDTRMKKYNLLRAKSGLTWELSSNGVLKSMNQHRRYLGLRDDNVLIDVSIRGDAARFEIICASKEQVIGNQPIYHTLINDLSTRSLELAVVTTGRDSTLPLDSIMDDSMQNDKGSQASTTPADIDHIVLTDAETVANSENRSSG